MRNLIKHLVIFLGILSVCEGCRSFSLKEYRDGILVKEASYANFGFDTKIGELDIATSQGGRVIVKDLDSNSQALMVAQEAVRLAATVVNPLVPIVSDRPATPVQQQPAPASVEYDVEE